MPRRPAAVLLAVFLFLVFELVSAPRSGAQSSADVILRPGSGATVSGGWAVVSDGSAAGGKAVRHSNAGAAKLTEALAQPVNYVEQDVHCRRRRPIPVVDPWSRREQLLGQRLGLRSV